MKIRNLYLLTVFCTMASVSLTAQTVIPLVWEDISRFDEKNGILTFSQKEEFLRSEAFPVNPDKTYTLIATMRCRRAADNVKSKVFLSFMGVDALDRNIQSWMVRPIPRTMTVLAEPARKGDKYIKVRNAKNFIIDQPNCLVFDAKADESDIPNKNFMTTSILRKSQRSDYWRITLKERLLRNYKAGTAIRQHLRSGYLYPIGPRDIGNDWVTYSASIRGILPKSGWCCNKWPKGTVSGKVVILPNWQFKRLETQIKDIVLIEH